MPEPFRTGARRVLAQLVEALLFERLVPLRAGRRASSAIQRLEFDLGSRAYACRGAFTSFGRARIAVETLRRVSGREREVTSWEEIAEGLPALPAVREQIFEELSGTARLCRENEARLFGAPSRRDYSYEELERALDEGHLYHPCFKARTGFTIEDHLRFGPEAGGSFPLEWFAVRRDFLCQALPCREPEFWAGELGAARSASLARALGRAGLSLEEYGLLPCHPWQSKKLGEVAADVLASGALIPLGVALGQYQATQSVRTLMVAGDLLASHVKLSLATRISSALRVLEPETVVAAPAVSSWLADVVESDEGLRGKVVILREYAGAALSAPEGRTAPWDGHLGVIFRESVRRYLDTSESATPFNALAVYERDGLPFVERWVARFGLSRWLGRLLEVTVAPLFRLLIHHGIALEAHAQNMVLIHRGGWPERLALRDFSDSVEYVTSYVAEPGKVPRFAKLHARFRDAPLDRYYSMSSLEELRELFTDTVFVFNLCELATLFAEHYSFPEESFFARVRAVLDGALLTRGAARRAALLGYDAPLVKVESLLERRLHGSNESRFHHLVKNPLSARRKERHARSRADDSRQ